MTLQQIDRAKFGLEWQEWHHQRELELVAPHGFLAVTGLYWLTGTPERHPGVPGAWRADGDGVTVGLDDGEELLIDGVAVHGTYHFGAIPERSSRTVAFGDAVVEVAKRGGRDLIRPRHPDHPPHVNFMEVPTYLPNPRWAFIGRYLPFEPSRRVAVGSVVEGLEHVYEAPGQVEFEFRGETFRLTAFNGRSPAREGSLESLTILFTDATSGLTTYAAGRVLHLGPPDQDGQVVLDFNRAINAPCAFTDFATCPLPPPENRLPIGIEVGEKTPYERS